MNDLSNRIEEEKPITETKKIVSDSNNEAIKNTETVLVEGEAANANEVKMASAAEPVVTDEVEEDIPTLYSERVIYVFSVFFSVIAGGILLSRNLKEVDRKDGIPHVIAFSVIYTFLSGYFLNVSKLGLVGTVTLAIIGSMILNSYFWNIYIGRGITYYRKSYTKALIIVFLILIPLFLLALWGAAFSGQQPAEGLRIN